MKSLLIILIIILTNIPEALAGELFVGIKGGGNTCGILFVKNIDKWEALDSYEKIKKCDLNRIIKWAVAFDGKNIGSILTTDPNPNFKDVDFWKRDKYFKIENPENAPKILNKARRFDGWAPPPTYRPIVIISQNNYLDKENWKPFKPDKSYIKILYPYVDAQIDIKLEPELTPNKLMLFRGYKNIKNEKIISIGIDTSQFEYADDIATRDPLHTPHWFLISNKKFTYIGHELDLIDAGDYDADGKIEFIFWHYGYNEGGYSLFDNEFKERVDYFYSYH